MAASPTALYSRKAPSAWPMRSAGNACWLRTSSGAVLWLKPMATIGTGLHFLEARGLPLPAARRAYALLAHTSQTSSALRDRLHVKIDPDLRADHDAAVRQFAVPVYPEVVALDAAIR